MKKFAVAAIIFLFIFSAVNAQEEKSAKQSIAHLSYTTGNTYIQKAADLDYEEGVVNMPISEGDRVGTTDGRAEIFLGRGNYIRLDKNTKIDFERFPNQDDRLFQFQVWSGNIYLSIRDLENEKDIEIHSSDVSVYILDTGLYRIDVRMDAETEIFVFNGLVEAAGESGSVLIKDEQRLEVTEGYFTSRPTSFFAASNDSFDRWSENRDSLIKQHLAKQNIPERLDPSWSLYSSGWWNWSPFYSWYSIPGYGWGPEWGPGWGSWYWGPDYFGWPTMSYWGYPGFIFSSGYYSRYRGPQYPYNSGSLTVIRKNQLKARNVSKVSLSKSIFTPTLSSADIQKLDPNKFSLKKKVSSLEFGEGKIAIRPAAKPALNKFKSYPSSTAITAKKYSSSDSSKKPSSAISRIYQQISKRSGSVSQGSSRSTSSSSRASSARSSSSKSSSSSSSRVKKIKK